MESRRPWNLSHFLLTTVRRSRHMYTAIESTVKCSGTGESCVVFPISLLWVVLFLRDAINLTPSCRIGFVVSRQLLAASRPSCVELISYSEKR